MRLHAQCMASKAHFKHRGCNWLTRGEWEPHGENDAVDPCWINIATSYTLRDYWQKLQPAVITDLQSHALGYFSGSVLLSIKRATAMGAYKLTFIKVGQWIYLPILLVRFIGSSGSLIWEMSSRLLCSPQGWTSSSWADSTWCRSSYSYSSSPFGWDNNFIIISWWCSGVLNCQLHWDLSWFIAWFNYVSKFN